MNPALTDIRGFTSLVEGMRPDEVMGFINQFLRHMDPVIRNNGGFVDSFIGDAILGLFDGGADRAVRAGVEMLRTLTRLNVQRARTNSAPIRMGIGINTGVHTLGTMGSDDHLKCGVLGDSVNLAARVESLTKTYGCSLLITGHTFRGLTAATEYRIRLVDHVRVMGKAEVVDLYEVYDADEPDLCARKDRAAPLWALARERYVAGDMAAARARFQEYGRAVGDDSVAALFAERCERFLKVGLPEAWSDVTDLDHK